MSDSVVDLSFTPRDTHDFYQAYSVAEDSARAAYHYEQDAEFYFTQTGGKWNVYSCLLWEPGFDITQAQEKKLDKMAELMRLQPGKHILDVGCGWGGPLVYLCEKYGVTGHGIAVSPKQIAAARERAARHGVPATFEVVNWQNLPEVETYDAIYSDEVIVHFYDLGGFYKKCYQLLKPGGMNVHKELHLTRTKYSQTGPLSQHVLKVFADTVNYVTLHRELELADESGLELDQVVQIPMDPHYFQSLDAWMKNIFDARDRLKTLAPNFYTDFRGYLKAVRHVFAHTDIFRLHIIATHKPAKPVL